MRANMCSYGGGMVARACSLPYEPRPWQQPKCMPSSPYGRNSVLRHIPGHRNIPNFACPGQPFHPMHRSRTECRMKVWFFVLEGDKMEEAAANRQARCEFA